MKKNIFLLCLAMAVSSSALAEGWYVDGGAGFVTFDDGVDTLSPTNLYIRGGYIINQNINIGLESSATISPDQVTGFTTVDFDVNIVTVYVRGGTFVNDNVWLYGQVGSSNTELTAEGPTGLTFSADDTDVMLGFGAEIGLGGSSYLALNYSIYNDNDGVDANAFNLGVGARF